MRSRKSPGEGQEKERMIFYTIRIPITHGAKSHQKLRMGPHPPPEKTTFGKTLYQSHTTRGARRIHTQKYRIRRNAPSMSEKVKKQERITRKGSNGAETPSPNAQNFAFRLELSRRKDIKEGKTPIRNAQRRSFAKAGNRSSGRA